LVAPATRSHRWCGSLALIGLLLLSGCGRRAPESQPPPIAIYAVVLAAGYGPTVAPDSVATVFGDGLAAEALVVDEQRAPAPLELGGVTVLVNGLPARLLYVSPQQVNLVIPAEAAPGTATVEVSNARSGRVARGSAQVAEVAPGLFTVDSQGGDAGDSLAAAGPGQGPWVAGLGHFATAAAAASPILIAQGATENAVTGQPGPFTIETNGNATRLAVFGTGFRAAPLAGLSARVMDYYGGSFAATVESVTPDFVRVGVDRLVFVLPRDVDTSGIALFELAAGSVTSNRISFDVLSQATCPTPRTFQEDPVPPGPCHKYALCFNYKWESTGRARVSNGPVPLPDLVNCIVAESVDYPPSVQPCNRGKFCWQSPPFQFTETDDPYVKPAAQLQDDCFNNFSACGLRAHRASTGGMGDTQWPGVQTSVSGVPNPFARDVNGCKPWQSVAPFTASQAYSYRCKCYGRADDRGQFSLPSSITRRVDVGPDGNGIYTVSKNGHASAWEMLPLVTQCERDNTCCPDPTFIQVSERRRLPRTEAPVPGADPGLVARITVPSDDALVRGEVPVFGLAHGDGFEGYRVEVGEGSAPSHWETVVESSQPQERGATAADLDSSANLPIHGNLATWDTGLRNYVYLPSHPPGHFVARPGTYAIRLTVTGRAGRTARDQVTVTVGDEIPDAWGGVVTSGDGRVTLAVPEQVLADSFRLMALEPVAAAPGPVPRGHALVGPVYAARETGEAFAREAALRFSLPADEAAGRALSRLGIFAWDGGSARWMHLDTVRSEPSGEVSAPIRRLASHYALLASDLPLHGSRPQTSLAARPRARAGVDAGPYLVRNDFEQDPGEWSGRDGQLGAAVSLVRRAAHDGGQALKITNRSDRGNFAVDVLRQGFDLRDYSAVAFDYRVPPGVRVDFLAKVAGRWYRVGFTGEGQPLEHRRVNIAHAGDIQGVVPDDRWHHAAFDLRDLLRTRTQNSEVEELVMASWTTAGYMKLRRGTAPQGASFYIDDFSIGRPVGRGTPATARSLLVDDFDEARASNALGGPTETFTGGGGTVRSALVAEPPGQALALEYDARAPGSFSGYASRFPDLDLRGYGALSLRIRGDPAGRAVLAGIADRTGREVKVPLGRFLGRRAVDGSWQAASIPLAAFGPGMDWGRIVAVTLSFEQAEGAAGTVLVDDLRFEQALAAVELEDFEEAGDRNRLGRGRSALAEGAAALTARQARQDGNGALQLSYGGDIGFIDRGREQPFSFALWKTELGGLDCSACGAVSFRIKGVRGGEAPNVYLDDGNFRWGVPIQEYATVVTDWQTVSIPLSRYAKPGVDLTHLAELQIAFEWEPMSGSVWVDDIRLGPEARLAGSVE
jgi:uncharacterized protein (TIGR03437 family)